MTCSEELADSGLDSKRESSVLDTATSINGQQQSITTGSMKNTGQLTLDKSIQIQYQSMMSSVQDSLGWDVWGNEV